MLNVLAASGAAFLIAVLWFDLMFDVQTRRHGDTVLPPEVLVSISSYYRRVTTVAAPMNRLISIVMLLTVAALVGELFRPRAVLWLQVGSFGCAVAAIGLAASRTVRNAVALGRQSGSAEQQSRLARTIYRDHCACLLAMFAVFVLQLMAAH